MPVVFVYLAAAVLATTHRPILSAVGLDYRARYVPADHRLLLPREKGCPLDRHTVTRMINKAGRGCRAGSHPPSPAAARPGTPRRPTAACPSKLAAMPGHRRLDTTLRHSKIVNRTVADEYFGVTNCAFVQTSIEFLSTLASQHDDAANKGQHHRAAMFQQLLNTVNASQAS